MASSSYYNPPCAACKFLRRKCIPGCNFAPYFPPEEPQKFANVHKIFGASNVTKLLNELPAHHRDAAVNSLAYEAEARVRDPVYGCVAAITFLQRQVDRLQKELDAANADLIRIAGLQPTAHQAVAPGGGGGRFYQTASFSSVPYPLPWSDNHYNPHGGSIWERFSKGFLISLSRVSLSRKLVAAEAFFFPFDVVCNLYLCSHGFSS